MRKPRSDSVIESLPAAQREQVSAWLSEQNLSYSEVVAKLADAFGVRTSVGALQTWFTRIERPRQYASAKGAADEFAGLMEGNFDEANIRLAKQLAFEFLSSPSPSIGAAKALLKIVGDSAKLKLAQEKVGLDARKVAILEARARQADAAEEVTANVKLTPEQKTARIREIFGLR